MTADAESTGDSASILRYGPAIRLALVLLAGLVLRSVHLDQPIVENYVGRQIPTAMVARNLERRHGFLHPQLDTGPFPNYFLVEPPVYQVAVVGLRKITGLRLSESGRLTSALAAMLGAWGLASLVRRRVDESAALAAAAVFSMLPIVLRYGRAFQPDMFMIGTCTAGLACWDSVASSGARRGRLVVGWLLTAVGIAAKATAFYIPFVAFLVIFRKRSWRSFALCASTLVPTFAWYAWAHVLSGESASRAAIENRDIWWNLLGFAALGTVETWRHIGRFLAIRAFTPLGLPAAAWGLGDSRRFPGDRLWLVWTAMATATMALLAAKLHHEYYWLCLAPPVAAGLGAAWRRIDAWGPFAAFMAALGFAAVSLLSAESTWTTPDEWRAIAEAGRIVADSTRPDEWGVAPEALLFHSSRRGGRLELTFSSASRAASEWSDEPKAVTPRQLVEFYRSQGARWVADLGDVENDVARSDLHDMIRSQYIVLIDRPEVLLAEFPTEGSSGHDD